MQRPTDLLHCRLEPSGKSHVFALHGQECRKSNAHPKCTMERDTPGWPKGMLYMLDIIEILRQGEQDWPVRLQAFTLECSCCLIGQEQDVRPLTADVLKLWLHLASCTDGRSKGVQTWTVSERLCCAWPEPQIHGLPVSDIEAPVTAAAMYVAKLKQSQAAAQHVQGAAAFLALAAVEHQYPCSSVLGTLLSCSLSDGNGALCSSLSR